MRRGEPFDTARSRALADLPDRDRRLAHEMAAGVLRQQRILDELLDPTRTDPRLHDVLRIGAYQLRFLNRVPAHAAVTTSVTLARERAGPAAAGYANRLLRHLSASRAAPPRSSTHPPWLLRRWRAQFGPAATDRLVAWNDTAPPLTIQPARWTLATLQDRLAASGIAGEPAPFGAGLRLPRAGRSPAPRSLPGYLEGGFIVQDSAAALVCRFAAIPAGHLVYDACAAPGGKAVTLEALGARVIAGDARRDRLARLLDTVRRAGRTIRVMAADLRAAPLAAARLDAVLIDAPCTATGTMARHPDARGRLTPRTLVRLVARQRALLDAGAELVRPGGLLVYATCSLEPEENTEQVRTFLERHPAFARTQASGAVPPPLVTGDGDLLSLPQRDGIDGAYAARLTRRA